MRLIRQFLLVLLLLVVFLRPVMADNTTTCTPSPDSGGVVFLCDGFGEETTGDSISNLDLPLWTQDGTCSSVWNVTEDDILNMSVPGGGTCSTVLLVNYTLGNESLGVDIDTDKNNTWEFVVAASEESVQTAGKQVNFWTTMAVEGWKLSSDDEISQQATWQIGPSGGTFRSTNIEISSNPLRIRVTRYGNASWEVFMNDTMDSMVQFDDATTTSCFDGADATDDCVLGFRHGNTASPATAAGMKITNISICEGTSCAYDPSLTDTSAPAWNTPATNDTSPDQFDTVNFTVTVEDDTGLSSFIFSTNDTGAWVNETAVDLSGTSDIASAVREIQATGGSTIGWKVYFNDTSDNWNETDDQNLAITDKYRYNFRLSAARCGQVQMGGGFDETLMRVQQATTYGWCNFDTTKLPANIFGLNSFLLSLRMNDYADREGHLRFNNITSNETVAGDDINSLGSGVGFQSELYTSDNTTEMNYTLNRTTIDEFIAELNGIDNFSIGIDSTSSGLFDSYFDVPGNDTTPELWFAFEYIGDIFVNKTPTINVTNATSISGGWNATIETNQSIQNGTIYTWYINGVEAWRDAGLVGYWKLDESLANAEGNSALDMTIVLAAEEPTNISGVISGGMLFDGLDDRLNVTQGGVVTIAPSDAFSVSAWFKTDGGNDTTQKTIFNKQENVNNVLAFGLTLNGSRYLSWSIDKQNIDANGILSFAAVETNRWYHVVGTYSNGFSELYIDGVLSSNLTFSTAGMTNSVAPFYIGNHYYDPSVGEFNGSIDEVRFYNRTLSAEEVANLYNMMDYGQTQTDENGGLPQWEIPIAKWSFDEVDGDNVTHEFFGGNDGTVSGAYLDEGVYGTQGLVFDGVDDYVDAHNDSSLDIKDEITISAWVKSRNVDELDRVVFKGDGNSTWSYGLTYNSSGNIRMLTFTTSQVNTVSPTTSIENRWYHFVGTYNGSVQKLYVDGVEVATDTQSGTLRSGDNLSIGANLASDETLTNLLNGTIDEVAIYNRSLSSDEISRMYNASFPQFGYNFSVETENNSIHLGIQPSDGFDFGDEVNSTSVDFTMQVNEDDTFPPAWSNAVQNSTSPNNQDAVNFSANWSDDIGLSSYIFSTNDTGDWVNQTATLFSGTENISEQEYTIVAAEGIVVGWKFYANDTSDNWNETDDQTFTVLSEEPAWSSPVTNTSVYETNDAINFSTTWSDNFNLSYFIFSTNDTGTWVNQSALEFHGTSNVSDQEYNLTALEGVVVGWKFYANDTVENTNVTDDQTFTINSQNPAFQNFAFNATDVPRHYVVNISIDVTDNVACDTIEFETNVTGSPANTTATCAQLESDTVSVELNITGLSRNENLTAIAYINDTSGNWNVTDHISFLIQNTPPLNTTISSPFDGQHINTNLTAVASCEDIDTTDDCRLELFVNNTGEFLPSGLNETVGNGATGAVTFNGTTLADGTYHYFVQVYDNDTGISNSSVSVFIQDEIVPTYSSSALNLANTSTFTHGDTLTFSETCSDTNIYQCRIEVNDSTGALFYENTSIELNNTAVTDFIFNDLLPIATNFSNGVYSLYRTALDSISNSPALANYHAQKNFDYDILYEDSDNDISINKTIELLNPADKQIALINKNLAVTLSDVNGTEIKESLCIDTPQNGQKILHIYASNNGNPIRIINQELLHFQDGSGWSRKFMSFGRYADEGFTVEIKEISQTVVEVLTYKDNWGSDATTCSNSTLSGGLNEYEDTILFEVDVESPAIVFVDESDSNNLTYLSRDYVLLNVSVEDGLDNLGAVVFYNGTDNSSADENVGASYFRNFTILSDGNYTFAVYANDTLGNWNQTDFIELIIDTTSPPAIGIDQPGNNTVSTSRNPVWSWLVSTFTNFANSTLEVSEDSSFGVVNFTNVTSDQSFISATVGTLTDNIIYYVRLIFCKLTGVCTTGDTTIYTTDNILPAIDYVDPTHENASVYRDLPINVSVTDTNLGNFTFRIYNSTVVVNETLFTDETSFMNVTGLGDGLWFYNVTHDDNASNSNTTEEREITLDTVNPSLSYIDPTPADGTNRTDNVLVINVSSSDANNDTVIFWVNGTITTRPYDGLEYVNESFTLDDGDVEFNVSANDSAGNEVILATRQVTIDTLPPAVEFQNDTENNASIINVTSIFINVTTSDRFFLNISIDLYNETVLVENVTSVSDNDTLHNFTSLYDGVWFFNVTVYDVAGNSNTTETRELNISTDLENPSVLIVSPVNASTINVENRDNVSLLFKAEDLSSLTCTFSLTKQDGTIDKDNATISGCENTSVDPSTPGVFIWNLYVEDTAGNKNDTHTEFLVPAFQNPSSASGAGGGAGGNSGFVQGNVPFSDSYLCSVIRYYAAGANSSDIRKDTLLLIKTNITQDTGIRVNENTLKDYIARLDLFCPKPISLVLEPPLLLPVPVPLNLSKSFGFDVYIPFPGFMQINLGSAAAYEDGAALGLLNILDYFLKLKVSDDLTSSPSVLIVGIRAWFALAMASYAGFIWWRKKHGRRNETWEIALPQV